MKFTLSITNECNLNCSYCYIGKRKDVMPVDVAEKIVNFIFKYSPANQPVEIGFFGGEPLLQFGLIKEITSIIEMHPDFNPDTVSLSLTTNGTRLNRGIATFINGRGMAYCVSCDGPPRIHDAFRRFKSGKPSSARIEANIKRALDLFPSVLVNAVYTPQTLPHIRETVEYFSALGIRQIYLTPDFSAAWTTKDIDMLPEAYGNVARLYVDYYKVGAPRFINMIDLKITAMLRGGYQSGERCTMGKGELAFAPSGNIYPCERLIGNDDGKEHCIGNISTGFTAGAMACKTAPGAEVNAECAACPIKEYCMNWCGCSNYFSSGFYNRVSPFLCASERSAVTAAHKAFQEIEKELGATFVEHLSGTPSANCMKS